MAMRGGRRPAAGVLCLSVFMVSGCAGTDEPVGAPSASPAQTLITPGATTSKPPAKQKPENPADSKAHSNQGHQKGSTLSRAQLDHVVARAQRSIDAMITGQLKKVYSDIHLEADYPDGVALTYVFRQQLPSSAGTSIAGQSDTFQQVFTDTIAPGLEMAGLTHPRGTFTFKNPDGSVIWSHTYHA